MKHVSYTCDRCGRTLDKAPATRQGYQPRAVDFINVETGVWETKDSDGNAKRRLHVDVTLTLAMTDGDTAELCRICTIDVLAEVQRHLYNEQKLVRMATRGEFVVQALHTAPEQWMQAAKDALPKGWVDCVREDIERDDLPARFDTAEEAAAFIENIRGLMYMGGADTQFQIVPFDRDPQLHEPEEQEP